MRSFRQSHGMITSFLILNITTGTVGGAMQLVVPLYAMSLQATTAEIGLIRGISGLGLLLLVIPAGFLVDHFGSKKLFLTGSLAGTLMTFALTFAKIPVAMVVLMGLSGLFSALKMTALNASFFRNLRNMGVEKAGWFKGSMSIGLTFIGPLLGGYLVKTIGFGLIFQLMAWLTLIPSALVFFFHKEPVSPGPVSELGKAASVQLRGFNALMGRRSLYLPLLTESISTACFATFSAFIVVIVVRNLHLPPATASLLLTAEGGVFILTVFIGGQLLNLMSPQNIYLLSFGITIIGLITLSFAGTLFGVVLATVVLGLGLGLSNLVTSARIGHMEGEKGKIVGLFSAAVGAGISLGPMIGGLIGEYMGNQFIFLAFIPLILFLGVLAVVSEPRREGELKSDARYPEKVEIQKIQ
ncbi:MAG: major facilitator superfamily [Geobacteraceae bacterium]|nr:MAG: major facilitator superfamily [Geobacteraceae bacterium]